MEANSDFQPPKKKQRKLDLAAQDRFAAAVSDENMAKIAKGYIPPNMQKNTDWAMRCFKEWVSTRNKGLPKGYNQHCPLNLLDNPDVEKVNYWISLFVAEVRNKKGEPYPPRSIHQLLAGLQRYTLEKHPNFPSFLTSNKLAFETSVTP